MSNKKTNPITSDYSKEQLCKLVNVSQNECVMEIKCGKNKLSIPGSATQQKAQKAIKSFMELSNGINRKAGK